MEIDIRYPTDFVITPRLGGLKRRNVHQLWEINFHDSIYIYIYIVVPSFNSILVQHLFQI